jgi:hypothetical protein
MGRNASSETIEVHDGIYVKRAGKNGTWQCYFRLSGYSYRKSTKTRDLAEAKLLALRWHKEASTRKLSGQVVEQIGFSKLRDDYLESIRGESKSRYHSETLKRHMEPFFGSFDDVGKIDSSVIIEYLQYRRGKVEKPPTPQTLNRENTVLRQLLRHALQRRWLKEVPQIKNLDEKGTRRRSA